MAKRDGSGRRAEPPQQSEGRQDPPVLVHIPQNAICVVEDGQGNEYPVAGIIMEVPGPEKGQTLLSTVSTRGLDPLVMLSRAMLYYRQREIDFAMQEAMERMAAEGMVPPGKGFYTLQGFHKADDG